MVAIAVVVALGMVLMGGVALGMVVWNEGRRCLTPKTDRPTAPPRHPNLTKPPTSLFAD